MVNVFAGRPAELVDCTEHFSFFFDLIGKIWIGTRADPLHRICTLMRKMGVKSVLQEDLAPFQELEEESEALSIRCGTQVSCEAIRLTFFRALPPSKSWHHLTDDDSLGYAVVAKAQLPTTTRTFILESVVRKPTMWVSREEKGQSPLDVCNYYVHCSRDFETTVGTSSDHREFRLHGTFFCQQNDLTHVCAHAALKTAINSSPRYRGEKLTSSRVNEILNIDHHSKIVGKYSENTSTGLSIDQIQEVVNELGLHAHVADFQANPAVDYQDYIYPLVESGCPTILGIANPNVHHVLAVLGHTSNSDRWTPEARLGYGGVPISPYVSTSAWADHFIVSDDNYGMYVTLPTDAVRNILVPKYNPNLHASLAISIVPSGVEIPGYLVEQSASWIANRLIAGVSPPVNNRWFQVLKEHPCVCRTLLCEKSGYLFSMSSNTDERGNRLNKDEHHWLSNVLPDRFWVTEITVPHLFSGNKRKLGDIVTYVAPTPEEYRRNQAIAFVWLPGIAWAGPGLAYGPFKWSLLGHVDLIRGEEQDELGLEW